MGPLPPAAADRHQKLPSYSAGAVAWDTMPAQGQQQQHYAARPMIPMAALACTAGRRRAEHAA